MARKYVCYICRNKDTDESMTIVKVSGQNRRVHIKNCHDIFIQEQEFKAREKKELDELVETIKEIHDIKIIPNQFYPLLQDLRNGNELFGRIGNKQYKQGYRYSTIRQAYIENEKDIKYWIGKKDFTNALGMLKYTLAIIRNNVDKVSKSQVNKVEDQIAEIEDNLMIDDDIAFNNAKDELDISKYL